MHVVLQGAPDTLDASFVQVPPPCWHKAIHPDSKYGRSFELREGWPGYCGLPAHSVGVSSLFVA